MRDKITYPMSFRWLLAWWLALVTFVEILPPAFPIPHRLACILGPCHLPSGAVDTSGHIDWSVLPVASGHLEIDPFTSLDLCAASFAEKARK